MNTINYQEELQKLIDTKQLVEVVLQDLPSYLVAYILAANAKYLTLAIVSSSATLTGVSIVRTSDIDSISIESIYLSELVKEIKDDSVYQRALDDIKDISEFTFAGFSESLEKSKTIVEITTNSEDSFAGRLVGHDDDIFVLDEYSTESDKRVKRTYFDQATIARISLDVAWLNTIARSLAEKNI